MVAAKGRDAGGDVTPQVVIANITGLSFMPFF